MTPYQFLAYGLHPKFRGRGLGDEHLRSVHQLVTSRWQEVSSDLCAFQAETNPFPQHMFEESFIEKVDPCHGSRFWIPWVFRATVNIIT